MWKGVDQGCDGFYLESINHQSGNREEDQNDKKNKNRQEQAMLGEMVQSGCQIVLLREDGMEQPMEAQAEKNKVLKLG